MGQYVTVPSEQRGEEHACLGRLSYYSTSSNPPFKVPEVMVCCPIRSMPDTESKLSIVLPCSKSQAFISHFFLPCFPGFAHSPSKATFGILSIPTYGKGKVDCCRIASFPES